MSNCMLTRPFDR